MYCGNCGKALNENDKFCDACGKRVNHSETTANETANAAVEVTANNDEDAIVQTKVVQPEAAESAVSTAETPVTAKPRKKWRKPVIIAAILVILSSLLVYAAPIIKNTAQKLYYSPEDYFKVVVKREIEDPTDDFGEALCTIMDTNAFFNDSKGKSSITLKVGDELYNLLEMANVDDLNEIKDSIGWIKSLTLEGESTRLGTDLSAGIKAMINDKDIVTLNTAMDDSGIYFDIPEINSEGIKLETDSMFLNNELGGNPFNTYKELIESDQAKTLGKIATLLPDEEATQKLLYKYICSIVDQVDNVSEDSQKITAGDLKQNCTKLTVSVNEVLLRDMLVAVLQEAKSDNDIKNIIQNFCKLDEVNGDFESVYSNMTSGIDEIINNLNSTEADTTELIQFNVWVNNVGELVGFGVAKDGVSFSATSLESGKKFGTAVRVEAGFIDAVSLEGNGKVSGNKSSGTFYVKAAGNNLAKIVSEYDVKKADDGIYDGFISIELTDFVKELIENMHVTDLGELTSAIADFKLIIEAKAGSRNSSDATVTLQKGSELCASLNVKSQLLDTPNKIDIPKKFASISNEEDMFEWLTGVKLNILTKNLKSAGAPGEIIEALTQADKQLQEALQPEPEIVPEEEDAIPGNGEVSIENPEDSAEEVAAIS